MGAILRAFIFRLVETSVDCVFEELEVFLSVLGWLFTWIVCLCMSLSIATQANIDVPCNNVDYGVSIPPDNPVFELQSIQGTRPWQRQRESFEAS